MCGGGGGVGLHTTEEYMAGSTVYWSIKQRQKCCISIQILKKFPMGATNIQLPLV